MVKYLYKYIHKGSDRIAINVGECDEVQNFLDCRYISPPEACWRIMGFNLHGNSHTVVRLPVHLPDQQLVNFNENADINELQEILESAAITKLTAFFHLCNTTPAARQYLYHEIPEYYTWNVRAKSWDKRRNMCKSMGRMYTATPAEGERFYLRLLLCNVRGPTSFVNLRVYNGVTYDSYKDAAIARCLLEDDREWINCMQDAALTASPFQLRKLFATILTFGFPQNIRLLWNQFYDVMSQVFYFSFYILKDIKHANPQIDDLALKRRMCKLLSDDLHHLGKQYHNFPGLPDYDPSNDNPDNNENELIAEETQYPAVKLQEFIDLIPNLNNEQRSAFLQVTAAVRAPPSVQQNDRVFFLDGPGGTGKTYLYNVILAQLRSEGKICLAVASSGIAAELLIGGRTAHSRFKIPLKTTFESTCNVSANSKLAKLLKKTDLIIWDEVPMSHKYTVETVDRTLRDITEVDEIYGGITVLFGGDFRQILPVIVGGTRAQIVSASLKRSFIWPFVKNMSLQQNMRVEDGDAEFHNFLLRVGE